jgi:hypothetical protein
MRHDTNFNKKAFRRREAFLLLVYSAVVGFYVYAGVFALFDFNGVNIVLFVKDIGVKKTVFFDKKGILAGRQFYLKVALFVGFYFFDEFGMDGGIKGAFGSFDLVAIGKLIDVQGGGKGLGGGPWLTGGGHPVTLNAINFSLNAFPPAENSRI